MNEQLISLEKLEELQKTLKYNFKNIDFLIQSLSHPSLRQHIQKHKIVKDNERLELLGDSIIGFVITEIIYKNFANYNEGKLATIKSHLICKEMLCKVAGKINLADYIIMTHGEEASGGRNNPNNIENATEALIAAIYLDSDIENTKLIVKNLWAEFFGNEDLTHTDPKSALQELVQSIGHTKPVYVVKSKSGSSHAPVFIVEVAINKHMATGEGHSIKAAEKIAAEKLLNILQNKNLKNFDE
jgi:ribonuclease III